MKPDMKPAFEDDGPPSAMAPQENNYSPHPDGPIPATNLDAEKGLETPPQQEEKEAQVRQITGFKWFLFLASTLTGIFIYALDNTIVADIIPVIVNEFSGVENLPWLSVGFMIGGVAMIMPYGKFYNLFNAKWVYIASFVLFQASSALCGGAPNMTAEIIGRVFAGTGGNGMYLGLLTLISVNTTDKERPAWLSLRYRNALAMMYASADTIHSGLLWGAGTVLGPVVGGGFELYNWRWAFYINRKSSLIPLFPHGCSLDQAKPLAVLFAAILAPIYLFILPSFDPCPGESVTGRLARFDFLGSLLSIGAIVCLIMGINFGGVLYEWNSGSIIALFVVSGILFIAFALQQIFTVFTTEDNRVFPIHLVRRKEPILLFIAGSSGGAAIYITLYYIPLYFQFTRGDTAIKAAVRLLPFVFILSAMVLANGFFMAKFGRYTPWYITGSIITLIGNVLMSKIDVNTSDSAIYGYEVLIAFGTGSFVQASFAVIQTIVTPAEMSYGITLMLVAQLSGLTLGLSIAGAVFLNLATNDLRGILTDVPEQDIQQLVSGTSNALFASLPDDVRAQSLDIIVKAMRTT
ncbi:MAG: hypothetical protein Q9199_007078 [Rusavskia elegans]